MFFSARLSKFTAALGFVLSASFMGAQSANATIVQFQTVLGDFSVNLYDRGTPKTVENFLAYVRAGAYKNTIIHRSVPKWGVVQGGGFKYESQLPLILVPQNAVVVNEPVYSNKRGTIAMAKGQAVNSATNQWFFNVIDNSSAWDSNTGGFTVFGEVTGNGMAIVDAMSALQTYNYSTPSDSTFSDLPLRNYMTDGSITDKQLVMILGIVILDENVDSAANLTPAKSTYTPSKSSGGGAINWASLSVLMLLACLGFLSRSRH